MKLWQRKTLHVNEFFGFSCILLEGLSGAAVVFILWEIQRGGL
jgi:hypothetical protein